MLSTATCCGRSNRSARSCATRPRSPTSPASGTCRTCRWRTSWSGCSATTTSSTSPRRSPAVPRRRRWPPIAREVHPNLFIGVPRVWEKLYAGVNGALAADAEKKQAFDEAIDAALPIMEKMTRGTATDEETGDLELPRPGRVPGRPRADRPRPDRDRDHRCRADPDRDPRLVPGDRGAAHRGLRHVRDDGGADLVGDARSPAVSAPRRPASR